MQGEEKPGCPGGQADSSKDCASKYPKWGARSGGRFLRIGRAGPLNQRIPVCPSLGRKKRVTGVHPLFRAGAALRCGAAEGGFTMPPQFDADLAAGKHRITEDATAFLLERGPRTNGKTGKQRKTETRTRIAAHGTKLLDNTRETSAGYWDKAPTRNRGLPLRDPKAWHQGWPAQAQRLQRVR